VYPPIRQFETRQLELERALESLRATRRAAPIRIRLLRSRLATSG
jgi:hypothetical protein